jgi:O-antigen ligase
VDVPSGPTNPIEDRDTGRGLIDIRLGTCVGPIATASRFDRVELTDRTGRHATGVLQRLRPWAAICLLALVLSGGLDEIAYLLGSLAFWAVWICALALMVGPGIRNGRASLVVPSRWFIGWMCLYCVWTVVVSPVSVFEDALKTVFHTVTSAAAIGVIGRDRIAWQRLAQLSTLAIVMNVALSLVFVQNHAVYTALIDPTHIDIAFSADRSDVPKSRLSGLWINPNEAGRQTLTLLAVAASVPGPCGVIGWIAAGWMTYLTASRTTAYIFLLIGLVHLARWAMSASWRSRYAVALTIFAVFIFVVANPQVLEENLLYGADGPSLFWTRVLDPTEKETVSRRSRLDVATLWLPYLERAPWYGYGYNAAMGSRRFDLSSRTDLPYVGIHNTYLGVWADGGLVMMASFVGLVAIGIAAGIRAPRDSTGRVTLMCLWLNALVFSMFAHSLQLTRDGQVLLLLVFSLPAVPLFQREPPDWAAAGQWPTTRAAVRAIPHSRIQRRA